MIEKFDNVLSEDGYQTEDIANGLCKIIETVLNIMGEFPERAIKLIVPTMDFHKKLLNVFSYNGNLNYLLK